MASTGTGRPPRAQHEAQERADRIRLLQQELAQPELQEVLALTPEQNTRFHDWSQAQLHALAADFDVDTSASQKRASWGMRIASTLGAIAICTAVVLFFLRFWGYLDTAAQVAIVSILPLVMLVGAEFAFRRERTLYFTGLLALVSFASFVMNLAVVGDVFNIASTERALLAWGAFAMVLAYRYGLRLLLAIGLLLLMSYAAAAWTAHLGYRWLDFGNRPEFDAVVAALTFCVPLLGDSSHSDFPPVYRVVGSIVFFLCLLSLAEWGIPSYLPLSSRNVERLYEGAGLLTTAGGIWLGIRRQWNGVVNVSATFFVIFLYSRLYHWWWDWMPKYLFFAAVGGVGILLVVVFRRMRGRMAQGGFA
ncbi:MAG TPA: DUF2157 domain-containing protein [Bryobacteraceae bacterium]|nr:DUF2157 domain-containing protein [Bryobacteraceae bacterium]